MGCRTSSWQKPDARVFNAGNNSPLSAGNSYSESTDGVASWFSTTLVRGWKYFGLWFAVGLNLSASTLGAPITATLGDRVYSLTFGTTLRASGFKDLVFPIVLASLVIFGTMLGSVADREKEVYTFSALGLAPVHVGGLFFAEAMIYAIVGGMGGYLLAQVSMPLFGFLAELGWLQVPDSITPHRVPS
jgi:hypothetical protein